MNTQPNVTQDNSTQVMATAYPEQQVVGSGPWYFGSSNWDGDSAGLGNRLSAQGASGEGLLNSNMNPLHSFSMHSIDINSPEASIQTASGSLRNQGNYDLNQCMDCNSGNCEQHSHIHEPTLNENNAGSVIRSQSSCPVQEMNCDLNVCSHCNAGSCSLHVSQSGGANEDQQGLQVYLAGTSAGQSSTHNVFAYGQLPSEFRYGNGKQIQSLNQGESGSSIFSSHLYNHHISPSSSNSFIPNASCIHIPGCSSSVPLAGLQSSSGIFNSQETMLMDGRRGSSKRKPDCQMDHSFVDMSQSSSMRVGTSSHSLPNSEALNDHVSSNICSINTTRPRVGSSNNTTNSATPALCNSSAASIPISASERVDDLVYSGSLNASISAARPAVRSSNATINTVVPASGSSSTSVNNSRSSQESAAVRNVASTASVSIVNSSINPGAASNYAVTLHNPTAGFNNARPTQESSAAARNLVSTPSVSNINTGAATNYAAARPGQELTVRNFGNAIEAFTMNVARPVHEQTAVANVANNVSSVATSGPNNFTVSVGSSNTTMNTARSAPESGARNVANRVDASTRNTAIPAQEGGLFVNLVSNANAAPINTGRPAQEAAAVRNTVNSMDAPQETTGGLTLYSSTESSQRNVRARLNPAGQQTNVVPLQSSLVSGNVSRSAFDARTQISNVRRSVRNLVPVGLNAVSQIASNSGLVYSQPQPQLRFNSAGNSSNRSVNPISNSSSVMNNESSIFGTTSFSNNAWGVGTSEGIVANPNNLNRIQTQNAHFSGSTSRQGWGTPSHSLMQAFQRNLLQRAGGGSSSLSRNAQASPFVQVQSAPMPSSMHTQQGYGSREQALRSAFMMEPQMPSDPYSFSHAPAADAEGASLLHQIRSVVLEMFQNCRGQPPRLEHRRHALAVATLQAAADLNDQHSDMRLDVDNMTYEELLALEERIGNVSTGLAEDTISRLLESKTYLELRVINATDPQGVLCTICRDDYMDNDVLGILDCGHHYHWDCIKRWLCVKNMCPICRGTALNVPGER